MPQGHIVAKIRVWGKIDNRSLPAKIIFVEMFSNGNRIESQAITNQLQKLPPLLGRFCFHLNGFIKGKKITGSGISFLGKAKISPPFLGLKQSIFTPSVEQKLTEYFLSVEYLSTHKDFICKGGDYTIKDSDVTWEDISLRNYNSEEFANLLQENNPDVYQIKTGLVIQLPYFNRNDLSLSSEDVKEKLDNVEGNFIEPTIQLIIDQFFLVKDEALLLVKWIYEAAQQARNAIKE